MWAAANEHPAAVEVLLEHGADVDAQSKVVTARPTAVSRADGASRSANSSKRSARPAGAIPDELGARRGVPPATNRGEAARLAAQRESPRSRRLSGRSRAGRGSARFQRRRFGRGPQRGARRARDLGRPHAARVRGAPGRHRVREAAARAGADVNQADGSSAGPAARGHAEPLLRARGVPARARRQSENRTTRAAGTRCTSQPTIATSKAATIRRASPTWIISKSSSCCSSRRRRQRAHEVEHRDAHDLHAPVAHEDGATPFLRAAQSSDVGLHRSCCSSTARIRSSTPRTADAADGRVRHRLGRRRHVRVVAGGERRDGQNAARPRARRERAGTRKAAQR